MNPLTLFYYLCAVAAGILVIGVVSIGLFMLYCALVGAARKAAEVAAKPSEPVLPANLEQGGTP